jgi:hypothetical protein
VLPNKTNRKHGESSMTIWTRTGLAALGAILAISAAHADGFDPIKGAFGETKYIFDSRLRMEDGLSPGSGRAHHGHLSGGGR